jgi:hypothetical protein
MSFHWSRHRTCSARRGEVLTSLILILVLALTGLALVSWVRPPRASAVESSGSRVTPGNGASAFRRQKKFAVLVAIEDYWWFPGPLNYCLEDLQDMKDVLVRNCGYDPANIFELKDASATVAGLNDLISNRLAPLEGPADTVTLFFSGHGWPDIFWSGEGLFLYDGIMFDWQLDALLSKLETSKMVVLLDSCFSGGFAGAGTGKGVQESSGPGAPSAGRSLTQRLSGSGRVVLAACDAGEQSDEYPALQNGLFTYYLCNALRSRAADADHDGRIDTDEAYRYLYPWVLGYSQNANGADPNRPVQHPQIYSGIPGGLELSDLSRAWGSQAAGQR